MKKMFFIGLILATIPAFAQKLDDSKVPAPVKKAFTENFAGATAIKWEKENGIYEVGFKQNNQNKSATFAPDGAWMETEQSIEISAVPPSATAYIAKNYKGEKLKEAAKLKLANGEIHYEAEVNGLDIIFDEKGDFIKTQKD